MPRSVLVLNGPNLNLLGTRQPELYGTETLHDVVALCQATAAELELTCEARQSNHEGELVTWIQDARGAFGGIVINPAGYSHTSVAILDALVMFEGPVIEVHISQIERREAFRHQTYTSQRADAVIKGCGIEGYGLALRRMGTLLSGSPDP